MRFDFIGQLADLFLHQPLSIEIVPAHGVVVIVFPDHSIAQAFRIQAIYPDPSFDTSITELAVIMVMIGGAGTVLGPILGAIAVQYMSEWLRENYTNAHTFILGALIIVTVVLLPQGFVNYLGDAVKTRRFSLLDNVRRYRL